MSSLSEISYKMGGMKKGSQLLIPKLKMSNIAVQIGSSMSSNPEGVRHSFPDGKLFLYSPDEILTRIA